MLTAAADLRRDWTRRRRARSRRASRPRRRVAAARRNCSLNRGIVDPEEARAFLDPPRPRRPGLGRAGRTRRRRSSRSSGPLDAGQKIVVYGDYDVDGLSGSTILQRALLALGATGRGLHPAPRPRRLRPEHRRRCASLAEQSAGLVITVDCGVTAAPEVAAANAIGLDVVVTDHHDVPADAAGGRRGRQSAPSRLPVPVQAARRRGRRAEGRPGAASERRLDPARPRHARAGAACSWRRWAPSRTSCRWSARTAPSCGTACVR